LAFYIGQNQIEPEWANSFLAGKLGLGYLGVLQLGARVGVRPWCDEVLLLFTAQVGVAILL
jgi:hypothetical protein